VLPVDTPGPFTRSVAPAFADRTVVAWDDGSWSWDGVTLDVRSRALVPVEGGVVTRALGAATLDGRRGTAWMESFGATHERIG
jgi:hypothetical protein